MRIGKKFLESYYLNGQLFKCKIQNDTKCCFYRCFTPIAGYPLVHCTVVSEFISNNQSTMETQSNSNDFPC